ncbi:MAG: two-component sensor histidine kinase [Desulfobacter sp.]|nr:MAG: two-component sensor histidine kinase [Desulfobacter sp.]
MIAQYKDKRPGEATTIVLPDRTRDLLNYKRLWLISFILTALFALVPVVFFAVMDYKLTQKSLEKDGEARTARLASNTWRTVSFFLDERKNALTYVARSNVPERLSNPADLESILSGLQTSFGKFTDIGIINASGTQVAYAGPYDLTGKNYQKQDWFKETMDKGVSVSQVFLGYRNVPHISIAIRHESEKKDVFVFRATIEHELSQVFSHHETTHGGDIFLVNSQGILQTPSRYFGKTLAPLGISLPPRGEATQSFTFTFSGAALIAAYRYIPDTPFVLMVVKSQKALMAPWHGAKAQLLKYLGFSIAFILIWIWAVTGYLIRRLRVLDLKRAQYCHLAEYANKMASIGRLAAGVAHEINNPLAIINEKAGLIKDMATFKPEYQNDEHLNGALDVILASVMRCSKITRQLLSFGRRTKAKAVPLAPCKVLDEVLVFLAKEAELKRIQIDKDIPENLPLVVCDHGKLQQVMLNIINNAFSAMSGEGRLTITAHNDSDNFLSMAFADTGCGISQENMDNIFDPFFSTKTDEGGTGLGLSITYGLVQEMGGRITVKSRSSHGTTFTVYLPTIKGGEITP